MNEEIKGDNPGVPDEMSGSTAVRIYERADASTEFPVLKAFQEYLEAEQAKAHKRMLSLSIFFIVLLVIVVLTFSVIALFMINRNQTLSDRLMDIALRDRTAAIQQPAPVAPVVNVQQPAPVDDSARLTPILAKLEAMEAELARARAAAAEAEARAKAQPAAPAAPSEDPQSAKLRAAAEREANEIAKQQAAVKAAREKLKAEQELLRKEQIEQQRRRLYPEYYAQEDARKAAEEAAKNPPPPPAEPVKPAAKPPVEPIRPPSTSDVAVKPKPPAPKKSALQLLLDVDDAPSATAPKNRISDEDADKVDAELRRTLASATNKPASTAKPAAPVQKPAPAAQPPKPSAPPQAKPSTEAKPKPPANPPAPQPPSPQPESIDVGAKEGETIPWLLGDSEAPEAATPAAKKPEEKKTDDKKPAQPKPEQKKPEEKDLKQNTNNNK